MRMWVMMVLSSPGGFVSTANNIHLLPPELLRKGRFGEIFFKDLPEASASAEIFRLHLAKRKRTPPPLTWRPSRAAEGFSGPEIEQALVSALYAVFAARRHLTGEDIALELRSTRLLPLTMKGHIDRMRAWTRAAITPM